MFITVYLCHFGSNIQLIFIDLHNKVRYNLFISTLLCCGMNKTCRLWKGGKSYFLFTASIPILNNSKNPYPDCLENSWISFFSCGVTLISIRAVLGLVESGLPVLGLMRCTSLFLSLQKLYYCPHIKSRVNFNFTTNFSNSQINLTDDNFIWVSALCSSSMHHRFSAA